MTVLASRKTFMVVNIVKKSHTKFQMKKKRAKHK